MRLGRRQAMAGAAAGALARPALAAAKPDKLVFLIDNAPWHGTMTEDAATEFERTTGIHVEFTRLPDDALLARLKAELTAGGTGIDITQNQASWGGWIAPHMEDHAALIAGASGPYAADFGWDDIPPSVRKLSLRDSKQYSIPYRVVMGVLHYQPAVLKEAGFDRPPATWDELRDTALAVTKAGGGQRYGLGLCLRQGPATINHWCSFFRSNGGRYYDPATHEVFINKPESVDATAFYGDLATRWRVVPPDAVTWEWDEIIANGQADRYGMTITFGPSGTMLNDPALSRTGGKWAAVPVPGPRGPDTSRTFLGGWSMGVSAYSKNKEWAFEFVQMITSREWSKRSMEKGNCPPRISVLNDPDVGVHYHWAPAAATALQTAELDPQDPLWGALQLPLRAGLSRVATGQSPAREAMDGVASNWARIIRRGAAL